MLVKRLGRSISILKNKLSLANESTKMHVLVVKNSLNKPGNNGSFMDFNTSTPDCRDTTGKNWRILSAKLI